MSWMRTRIKKKTYVRLELGTTLAGSELGVIRSLVALGTELLLLLQHPVLVLGGLALI